MTEIEKLISKYQADDSSDEVNLVLIEMLLMERRAYMRLRKDLTSANNELDDACALHEIGVCHKKREAVIRLIIGE